MAPKRAAALKKLTYDDNEDRGSTTLSPSPPPSDNDEAFEDEIDMDVKPTIKKRSSPSKPVSTPRKRSKVIKASPSTPTDGTPPTSSSAGDAGSVDLWADVEGSTPEKRAAIVMLLFDEGAKSLGLAVLAKKFNLPYQSMVDALRPKRGGNLRDKSIKAVQ